MRTAKWCLVFGVTLAGVVVGYCRHCHDDCIAPLPPMLISFDGDCCEEGCQCGRHDGTSEECAACPDEPRQIFRAMRTAEIENTERVVR